MLKYNEIIYSCTWLNFFSNIIISFIQVFDWVYNVPQGTNNISTSTLNSLSLVFSQIHLDIITWCGKMY